MRAWPRESRACRFSGSMRSTSLSCATSPGMSPVLPYALASAMCACCRSALVSGWLATARRACSTAAA
eukprot:scaffold90512_cov72-Phaeocystis_antarctica.AAC.7